MGSISGRITPPYYGAYAASKHALEAMADAWRMELGRWGIRASIMEPDAWRRRSGTSWIPVSRNWSGGRRAESRGLYEQELGPMRVARLRAGRTACRSRRWSARFAMPSVPDGPKRIIPWAGARGWRSGPSQLADDLVGLVSAAGDGAAIESSEISRTMLRARIIGISGYLPERIETDEDLRGRIPTGICRGSRGRPASGPGTSRPPAKRRAIWASTPPSNCWPRQLVPVDQIDYLIMHTQTPDHVLPPNACLLQQRLQLAAARRRFRFQPRLQRAMSAVCSWPKA